MFSSTDNTQQEQEQEQSNPQNLLGRTFRTLKNYTSTLANFILLWQDLEDHFLSIKTQLQDLEQTKTKPSITQSENNNLGTKACQIENPCSKNNENTIKLSKSSSLPIDNGKSLLLYFDEHLKEHSLLKNAIPDAFKEMSNPGKVVLQALRFYYDQCNSSSKLDVNVTRKSCVVFLEELNKLRCLIGDQERDEAMKMALEWKVKMKNSLEVLGFLLLVRVFGLVDEFDKAETFRYFDNVLQLEQAPQLFRAFGFADKAHDFVQKLIDKNKRVEAVPFIYEFELVDKLPPVALLRAHAEYAEECYRKICNKGNNSPKALDNATGTQLAALRSILKLIEKYKLESQYSTKIIRNRMLQLTKHKYERKPAKISPNGMVLQQQQSGNKHTAADDTQPNEHGTSKRLRMVVPTSPSTVSINTPISSKPQSYYQEAGLHSSENTEFFPSPSGKVASAANVASACVNTSLTSYSTQSPHMQTAHSIVGQRAQHLIPSSGLYNGPGSSAFTVHANSTDSLYGEGGSTLGTLPMSAMAGQYGSGSSIPVTHQFASTVGLYGSIASTTFRPHMNLLDLLVYHSNATNEDTEQLRSAGFPYSN